IRRRGDGHEVQQHRHRARRGRRRRVGHRCREQGPSRQDRRKVIAVLRRAGVALAIVLVSCSAPPPAAAPSGPEKVTISEKTPIELVAVMKSWQAALAKKDLAAFQATIDLTRAAFRRCQSETFDIASRQGFTPTEIRVAKVEPY